MTQSIFPDEIRDRYFIHEWRHAGVILKYDFPNEWQDIIDLLQGFKIKEDWIVEAGGRKSKIAGYIDSFLYQRDWQEKQFLTSLQIDETTMLSPTHKIDCYKNRIALEVEWNNKDPFFDRDLNNFRLLFDLRAISVGIIMTRCDELQSTFNRLGRGAAYGASTTHLGKLLPRIQGGSGGGCPLLVFGMTNKLLETS